jgi:hypothetical protein
MTRNRRTSLLPVSLLTLALAACDPGWYLAFRQPVAPTTLESCVAQVLRADRRIDSVAITRERGLHFGMRDSMVRSGLRWGWVSIKRQGRRGADTLRTLEIAVMWQFYAGGVSTDSARTRQLVSFGREVTEQVRHTCTPSVPSAVSCHVMGAPWPPSGGCESAT